MTQSGHSLPSFAATHAASRRPAKRWFGVSPFDGRWFWWASRLLISLLTIVTACEPYPAKSAYQRDQARHADNDPFGSRHGPQARDYNLSRGNWPAAAHTNRTTSTPIAM